MGELRTLSPVARFLRTSSVTEGTGCRGADHAAGRGRRVTEEQPRHPRALSQQGRDAERPTDVLWQERCHGLVLPVSCSVLDFRWMGFGFVGSRFISPLAAGRVLPTAGPAAASGESRV